MADFNDVVRHVILRISVDQAGLAEELAAARAKLKGLKDAEEQTNKERTKSADAVTKAIEAQNSALDDNRQAHEAAQRAAVNGGRAAAEEQRAATQAVKDDTKAVESRTVAEAKAAQVDSQTRQKELDAQRSRSAAKKKDADDEGKRAAELAAQQEKARQARLKGDAERSGLRSKNEAAERDAALRTDALKEDLANREKQRVLSEQASRSNANKKAAAEVQRMLADAAKLNEQANAVRSNAQNQRRISRDESSAKVARQDYSTIAGQERKDTTSAASIARADESAAADRSRLDANAAKARELSELQTTQKVEAARLASEQKIGNAAEVHEERIRTQRAANEQKLISQALNDIEKIADQRRRSEVAEATRQSNLLETQRRNVASQQYREATQPVRVEAEVARNEAVKEISGARTDSAQSQAQVAAARAANAEDKTAADIESRRIALAHVEERVRADIAKVVAATALTEQRALEVEERRVRAAQKQQQASNGLFGSIRNILSDATKLTATAAFAGPETTRLGTSVKAFKDIREEGGRGATAVRAFFGEFRKGEHDAANVLEHITARLANVGTALRSAASGGGGIFNNTVKNLNGIADSVGEFVVSNSRHLFSFQSAIVAVIAALGPLAAILGAVGAAALGLASNLGALTGVFGALPGLIGAAVAGFGALFIAVKPLSGVFSAYSAAAKEAITSTNAATTAALSYQQALLQQQDAEVAYERAKQDAPRLQTALHDARKQATRDIEDYTEALKKQQYEEESAKLGVQSSLESYRRTLADPTATKLDREQALNALQGSEWDAYDQKKNAKRTQEDASEAFKKGVDGADAVVQAQRAVEDETNKVKEAYIAWQQAIIATKKAALENAAGGTAAAALQAQLGALPPKTRIVAKALLDLLKGPYKQFKNALSENVFGPISGETAKFKDILGELESFLTPASKAIGLLAKSVLDMLDAPAWKSFLSQQGQQAAGIITVLGNAALKAADGFKAIVTATGPFTEWIVARLGALATSFDNWANSTKGKNGITDFLENTEKRISELWPIIKNFAAGIAGFFTALNTPDAGQTDFTTSFNKGLLEMSANFRKLGEAAANPNSGFRRWLREVLPLLGQIGHFLGAAGSAFAKLFSDPRNIREAEAILHALATKWLPALAEIFGKLSASGFISRLARAIGDLFQVLERVLDGGGIAAFRLFGQVLETVASTLDTLTAHVPFLTQALGGLLAALGLIVSAALFKKLLDFLGVLKGISKLYGLIRGADNPSTPGTPGSPGTPGKKPTGPLVTPGGGTGSTVVEGEELTVLRRMEMYLRQIAINTGGTGNTNLNDDPNTNPDDDKNSKHKNTASEAENNAAHSATKNAEQDVVHDVENAATHNTSKVSWLKKLFGGGSKNAAVNIAEDVGENAAIGGGGSLLSKLGKLLRVGGKSAGASVAATAGEDVAKTGVKGLLTSAAKGSVEGLPGIVAAVGTQIAGTLLVDKFVKSNKDKNSVNNGIGSVSTGAALGALLGSVIPGLGTAVGGVVGGALGGAKAYATDPNLRHFVNHKVATAADNVKDAAVDAVKDPTSLVTSAIAGPGAFVADIASKTDIGKKVIESLKKAVGPIGDFFTKTIPHAFNTGVKGVENFFTHTLPSLPGKFFDTFFYGIGRVIRVFTHDIPATAKWLFTKAIPGFAAAAWHFIARDISDPFIAWIKSIPGFFTKTIPEWFKAGKRWFQNDVATPVHDFVTKTIPEFFTQTVPKWFHEAPHWFKVHVKDPIQNFFTVTVPGYFTKTLPAQISGIPGTLWDKLIHPIASFLGNLGDGVLEAIKGGAKHVGDWAKALWDRATSDVRGGVQGKMSGGLIAGIYQGVEDTAHVMATPGEFMMRKARVDEPGAKAVLTDWNEGRIQIADLYRGLSASTAPQVMSIVPPDATQLTGAVPTIVNHTINHAPVMGDVTIHNPVRERSERSLRRQVEIASIRHRR